MHKGNVEILPCAIDAMGGDSGPSVTVEGAVACAKELNLSSILVGPEGELRSLLDSLGAKNFPIEIVNSTQVISMDDSPVKSVRKKPDSSLCVAYNLLEQGKASSVLSAGNSGAMMAAGRMLCGLLPGIERPAIAALLPISGGDGLNVILDSGANVDCDPHNLVQFAIMGSIYHKSLFGSKKPRVGLLSNGTERSKGNSVIRGSAELLTSMQWVDYIGFVEGRDVATDKVDVIVCDGFVGNVVLKSMEGCVKLIYDQLKYETKKNWFRKVTMSMNKSIIRSVFRERFDYTAHGGAPLLGLSKLAIVLHGSSDARAVKNAIKVSANFAKSKMTEQIKNALMQLDEEMIEYESAFIDGVFPKEILSKKRKNKSLEESKTGSKED